MELLKLSRSCSHGAHIELYVQHVHTVLYEHQVYFVVKVQYTLHSQCIIFSTISASSSESLNGSNIGLIAAGVSLFFTGLIFAVVVAVTLTLRLKKCAGGTHLTHVSTGHVIAHVHVRPCIHMYAVYT